MVVKEELRAGRNRNRALFRISKPGLHQLNHVKHLRDGVDEEEVQILPALFGFQFRILTLYENTHDSGRTKVEEVPSIERRFRLPGRHHGRRRCGCSGCTYKLRQWNKDNIRRSQPFAVPDETLPHVTFRREHTRAFVGCLFDKRAHAAFDPEG